MKILNQIADLFGHKPVENYKLEWHYNIGFYTRCRFCGKTISRDYYGKWHITP